MANLLRLLLSVAEKAANVARVCRQEAPLFELLVQEKTGADKNKKFVQDFKTLADVVIQEMIRHDVCAQVLQKTFNVLFSTLLTCLLSDTWILTCCCLMKTFCNSFPS